MTPMCGINGEWAKKLAAPLPEERNQQCVDRLKASKPTDYIYLTSKEDTFLIDLWEKPNESVTIPSDLFFAKTVPLLDCVISVDESNIGGNTSKYRVLIFDEYADTITATKDDANKVACVGVVSTIVDIDDVKIPGNGVMRAFDTPLFIPIIVKHGIDSLLFGGIGSQDMRFIEYAKPSNEFVNQWFISMMETWYGIQIALLHPAVKDVFKYPQVTKEPSEPKPRGKRQRKTKYIRKHYLTVDKLEAVSNSHETRKINRKCLAWYVIGHWRTYKNGTTTFVMPYWKGVLRHIKQNAEGDPRQREINIEWDSSFKKSQEQGR